MSDGKTHLNVSIGASGGIVAGSILFYITYDPLSIFLAAVGCWIQIIMSPDLDVDDGYIGDYYLRKVGLEWWYDLFWYPYRIGFKHRSKWSHFPIISTLLRLIYLVSPIIISTIFSDQDSGNTPLSLKIFALSIISQILAFPIWVILGIFYYYGRRS
jgi:uncharacterized metal-binding protein